ncbi:unnamed protein product [Sphagnum balticum]
MSRRSPPRHRHDGTSPLPLGMDASPPPSQWNGAQTKWPHDSRSGWSYCAFIPSWVVLPEAKAVDGSFINPIVFFRVQVGIQSPEGVSTLRGILRRFSDFLKLFAALKRFFPKKKLPAAPAKHSLMRMNSNNSLLQERRYALEDWLGRLLADIVISRSAPMASFLELEAAARFGLPPTNDASSHLEPSSNSRVSWIAGGSSIASGGLSNLEFGSDGTYTDSGVGTSMKGSDNGLEIEMKALAIEEQSTIVAVQSDCGDNLLPDQSTVLRTASHNTEEGNQGGLTGVSSEVSGLEASMMNSLADIGYGKLEIHHRRVASQDSIASEISSVPGSELSRGILSDMPLEGSSWGLAGSGEPSGKDGMVADPDLLKGIGLIVPVDQRGKVRLLMVTLQRRLAVVKADMEDVLARLKQETAVKEFLTAKVRDLEGEVDRLRRKGREVLQEAVLTERDHVTSLQWELEECRAALHAAEETAHTYQDARVQTEQGQKEAEVKLERAEKAMQEMVQQLQSLQSDRDAVESQARTDKKLLVKEVRSLRQSQNELKQEAAHALEAKAALELSLQEEKHRQEEGRSARLKFLHEMGMLRKRLQECRVEILAKEDDTSANENRVAAGMTDAFELLSTSDNRISLLLAEAQLLAQDDVEPAARNGSPTKGHKPHSNGDTGRSNQQGADLQASSSDMEMESAFKKMLTDMFIDQAQLQRSLNSLTRNALVSNQQQRKDPVPAEASVVKQSLLNRFL